MKNYYDDHYDSLKSFLNGKPEQTLILFHHFVNEFQKVAPVTLHPAKTMIGIANSHKKIAYITQLGKNFIHVVFPLRERYEDNFCFQKIAQVPDSMQFNHHFRMLQKDDVNDEVREFMRLVYNS